MTGGWVVTESAAGITKLPNSKRNKHRVATATDRGIQGEGEEMVHESFTSSGDTDINNTFHTEEHIGGMLRFGEEAAHLG